MAIVKMKKLRLIAAKAQKDEILEKLMLLGCVEPDSQDFMFDDPLLSKLVTREFSDSTPYRTQRQIYGEALKVLDKYASKKSSLLSSKPNISQQLIMDEKGESETKAVAKELGMLDEKLRNLKNDEVREKNLIEALTPWKTCPLPLDHGGTKNSAVVMGMLPADTDMDALSEAMTERSEEFALFEVSRDENCIYLYMICHRECEEALMSALREYSFVLPAYGNAKGMAAELMKESMEYLDYIAGDRERSEGRIIELAVQRDALQLCYDRAGTLIDRSDASDLLMGTSEAIVMQAWVTAPEAEAVEAMLNEFDCAYSFEDPVEEEYGNVPVKLKNNPLTDGLNMVTDMYSLPQYGSVDANPLMAPFFLLFYGIMMADMGYGLIMILAGLLITFKLRPQEGFMKYFGELMIEGGISTFIWGAVTGGFFGDAPYWVVHILNPESTWPGLPALFSPLNDTIMVLIGAIILGFIHLNAGMVISFCIKKRDGRLADALWYEGGLWLVFITAGLAFLKIGTVSGVPIPLIVALALFLFGTTRDKKGMGKLIAPFSTIYSELTGWFGDLLSYARLMALMLAGSVIAQVFNTLGAMPGNIFVFLIIAILGNALNFALNLLGCYVHDLRLQCLEFFNKFYTDGGRPFKPLKVKSKFYNVTK